MQDVLVYNFFSDSPFKSKWRVLYNYLKDSGLVDSDQDAKKWACPPFDAKK